MGRIFQRSGDTGVSRCVAPPARAGQTTSDGGYLMRRITAWATILVIVLATTAAMAKAAKRDVVLNLRVPDGATPQLRITEGETGSVELQKLGKFGFVPTLPDETDTVVVEMFDLCTTPRKRIDR